MILKTGFILAIEFVVTAIFAGCCCCEPAVAQEKGWGHLTGRIVVNGTIPEPDPLVLRTDDMAFCVATGKSFVDRSLIVGADKGLQNACVMMYFARGDDNRPEVHPSYAETAKKSVEINNKECSFEPYALFVRTGQVLTLKNSDAIGHNCHIVTMGNEENVSLGAGLSADVRMELSDKVPGIVKCDIHPWMGAVILVRDEPYACFTDAEGKFRIENIPAGKWTFQFWHQRPGMLKELKRGDQPVTGRRGEIEVTIENGKATDLGELNIDVASLSGD
jgi:plastocyanin